MKQKIELIWGVDSKGYTLLPESTPNKNKTIIGSGGAAERIHGNGGTKRFDMPLLRHPTLFLEFSTMNRNSRSLLEFVEKYGRLTAFGKYDFVPDVFKAANAMNLMRERKSRGGFTIEHIQFKSRVEFDAKGEPTLILSPKALLDALWLQLAEHLSNGSNTVIMECALCSKPFPTGAGTGRKLHATYCCNEHRILYNSRKRTPR